MCTCTAVTGILSSVHGDSSSATPSASRIPLSHSVSFGNIEMKEYEVIVSDNPSCSGAPIGIGWRSSEVIKIDIDDYETNRAPRRERAELIMSPIFKRDFLTSLGISGEEIAASIRVNRRIRTQRQTTYENRKWQPVEEKLETIVRYVKRVLLRKGGLK